MGIMETHYKDNMTEEEAKEHASASGSEVKVGKFPFIGNGKAIALGEAEGFIKTVFDAKTGELLGEDPLEDADFQPDFLEGAEDRP